MVSGFNSSRSFRAKDTEAGRSSDATNEWARRCQPRRADDPFPLFGPPPKAHWERGHVQTDEKDTPYPSAEPPAVFAGGPRAVHEGGDVRGGREPGLSPLLRGARRCPRD